MTRSFLSFIVFYFNFIPSEYLILAAGVEGSLVHSEASPFSSTFLAAELSELSFTPAGRSSMWPELSFQDEVML